MVEVEHSTESQGCKSVQNSLPPDVKDLIFALAATRSDDTIAPGDPREVWTPVWCQNVFARYNRSCPPPVLASAGVVVPATIATMAVILAVLYRTGEVSPDDVADILDAIESAVDSVATFPIVRPLPPTVTADNAADVGPGANTAPVSGVDKYAFQHNCNQEPTNKYPNRGPSGPGSSDILGERLGASGCGCPDGGDAHHILPKADGQKFPAALRTKIRQCLHNAGIDVDHPANGVCLPHSQDPNTKAVIHGSANKSTYWNSVADLCQDAYESRGAQGVREMLDQAREHLLNGNRWWKPGFDPFCPE